MDLVKREREVLRVSFVQGLIIGTSSKEKIGARAAKKKKNWQPTSDSDAPNKQEQHVLQTKSRHETLSVAPRTHF